MEEISYERRVYELVDVKSLSYATSQNLMGKNVSGSNGLRYLSGTLWTHMSIIIII